MPARAATTFYWRGTASSVFTASGNWVITGGGAPDADDYPGWDNSEASNVNGDTIIFDAAVTNAPAGADISAKGEIAGIKVYSAFDKGIASAGAKLIVNMTAAGVVYVDAQAADGDIYLKGAGAQGLTSVTVLGTQTTGTARTLYLDGTIGSVNLIKGAVNLQATAAVGTALNIGKDSSEYGDVTLTITAGATVPATVNQSGGIVTCNIAITTLQHSGGRWTQAVGNITALWSTGGEVSWNAGDITTAHMIAGSLIGSAAQVARTCTTLNLYGDARLDLNTGVRGITITTLNVLCDTPSLQLTPGQSFGITG